MAEPSVEEATALVEELYEARDKRFAPAVRALWMPSQLDLLRPAAYLR